MSLPQFTSELITKEKLNVLVEGINEINQEISRMTVSETIYVGVGQPYTNLSSALNYAKNKKPDNDFKIEIIVKTGFTISEQLIYENVDFGHVIISSEDAEVNVDVSGFTIAKYGSYKPMFYLKNGNCPYMNIKLKGNDYFESASPKYKSMAFYLINSKLEFANNKGFYNFGYGLVCNFSSIVLPECNVKNIIHGIRANFSNLNLYGSDFSDAYLSLLLFVSCIADISEVILNSTNGGIGCSAENSMINGYGIESTADIGFSVGYGGTYNIGGTGITGNATKGIILTQGGVVNASQTTCTLSQTANTITSNGIIFR